LSSIVNGPLGAGLNEDAMLILTPGPHQSAFCP